MAAEKNEHRRALIDLYSSKFGNHIPLVRRHQKITRVLMLREVRVQFAKIAVEPVGGSVAETAKFFADEREKWQSVIKSANVTVE